MKRITLQSDEYLRRNLVQAKSVGIEAAADKALKRLRRMKRPPLWMIDALEQIQERIGPVREAVTAHRDEEWRG